MGEITLGDIMKFKNIILLIAYITINSLYLINAINGAAALGQLSKNLNRLNYKALRADMANILQALEATSTKEALDKINKLQQRPSQGDMARALEGVYLTVAKVLNSRRLNDELKLIEPNKKQALQDRNTRKTLNNIIASGIYSVKHDLYKYLTFQNTFLMPQYQKLVFLIKAKIKGLPLRNVGVGVPNEVPQYTPPVLSEAEVQKLVEDIPVN